MSSDKSGGKGGADTDDMPRERGRRPGVSMEGVEIRCCACGVGARRRTNRWLPLDSMFATLKRNTIKRHVGLGANSQEFVTIATCKSPLLISKKKKKSKTKKEKRKKENRLTDGVAKEELREWM